MRLIVLLVVGGSLMAGCQTPVTTDAVTTAARVPVTVGHAAPGTVEALVQATASVVPAPGAELLVSAPALARVARMPFGEGQQVARGAVLVEFDIPALAADVAARHSDLEQARSRVALAASALARINGLFDRGIAAQREVEAARREQADADAVLTQASAARAAATQLEGRQVVRAPFAGFVARRWHNPGDLVDGVTTDPVLRLVDPSRLEVEAQVPGGEAGRVQPGQLFRVRSASADAGATGRILGIPVQVNPGSATFRVRGSLAGALALPLGLPVDIAIVVERRVGVLTVPAGAIVRDGTAIDVYALTPDRRVRRTPVTVGLVTSETAEILTGITAGTEVVIDGHIGLPDGATVEVRR